MGSRPHRPSPAEKTEEIGFMQLICYITGMRSYSMMKGPI
jgi:hypothetical protein